MVPVSVRTVEERGALGNRLTTMMAPLPVGIEDPVRRPREVKRSMGDLKESKQALGATLLTQLADFAADAGRRRPPACSRASASSTWWSPTSRGLSSPSI